MNTAKKIVFQWTVPEDGPEGYSLEVDVCEKKTGEGYFEPITSCSETFELSPDYTINYEQCRQNGDNFDLKFAVTNSGNAPAPEGTSADLILQALHGDLKERYGMDTDLLFTEDISGLAPGETREVDTSITIPVSVFRFCGYDAVTVSVTDEEDTVIASTDQELITLPEPMNLMVNGGKDLTLRPGETETADFSCDSTVFIDMSSAPVYSVADPSIASVDGDGNVTALSEGTTTLTATVLPSGRTASVRVTVEEKCPLEDFEDLNKDAWYHDGIHWALENGVMKGVSSSRFDPSGTTSRAMIVTMLYRMEGEPESDYQMTFQDVPAGKWYTEAIRWAAENKIVSGYNDNTFGPKDEVTRQQLVTILMRYANYKGIDTSEGEMKPLTGFDDTRDISAWANSAFRWAVDAGIINGMGNGKLSPKSSATRAQVATVLLGLDRLLTETAP